MARPSYSCQSVNKEGMHIISKRPFNEASRRFPGQRSALAQTFRGLKQGRFQSPDEMRKVFPSLDKFQYRNKWWVLDIGGNHLRLIAYIHFAGNRMYVKSILTHAEYDKMCLRYAKGKRT